MPACSLQEHSLISPCVFAQTGALQAAPCGVQEQLAGRQGGPRYAEPWHPGSVAGVQTSLPLGRLFVGTQERLRVWEQQGPSRPVGRITAPMAGGAPRPATFNVKNMAYKSLLPDGRPNPHVPRAEPVRKPVIQPPGGGPPSRPIDQAPAQVCKHLCLSWQTL